MNLNYNKLLKDILKYKNIYLFHHCYPDMDSLGSQYGLYYWMKENFSDKNIYMINCSKTDLPNKFVDIYKTFDNPGEVKRDSLGIILDTHNIQRVDSDEKYLNLNKLVIVDHHILDVDKDLKYIAEYLVHDCSASSTCEIIADFLINNSKKYSIPFITLQALFIGIITDTNRFMYENTSSKTFKIVQFFLENKISPTDIYNELYPEELKNLQLKGYMINNVKIINQKLAYFFLENKILKKYKVDYKDGKAYVNVFAGIKDVEIWVLASYDEKTKLYNLSIRSRKIPINDVAKNFNGSGHKLASGCKLAKKTEIPNVLKSLEKLIIEFYAKKSD